MLKKEIIFASLNEDEKKIYSEIKEIATRHSVFNDMMYRIDHAEETVLKSLSYAIVDGQIHIFKELIVAGFFHEGHQGTDKTINQKIKLIFDDYVNETLCLRDIDIDAVQKAIRDKQKYGFSNINWYAWPVSHYFVIADLRINIKELVNLASYLKENPINGINHEKFIRKIYKKYVVSDGDFFPPLIYKHRPDDVENIIKITSSWKHTKEYFYSQI